MSAKDLEPIRDVNNDSLPFNPMPKDCGTLAAVSSTSLPDNARWWDPLVVLKDHQYSIKVVRAAYAVRNVLELMNGTQSALDNLGELDVVKAVPNVHG